MFVSFFLCPCVAFLRFFFWSRPLCSVSFPCSLSLSVSPFSHCYLAEVLISVEKEKTSTSTDLATSCFSLRVFPVLRYFAVTFAQGRHSLSAAFMWLFSFSSFFFFLLLIGVACPPGHYPSSILPLRGWRLAISIPTPPLRLPRSS